MERAVLLADEGFIHSYHLPINLQPIIEHLTEQEGLEARLARVEYDMIVEALTSVSGQRFAYRPLSEYDPPGVGTATG